MTEDDIKPAEVEKPVVLIFPQFDDKKGNIFIFPGLHNDFGNRSMIDLWYRSQSIQVAIGVERLEEDFKVLPDENGEYIINHVTSSAGSSGFAHGSETVWLIAGPEFDSIVAAPSQANNEDDSCSKN